MNHLCKTMKQKGLDYKPSIEDKYKLLACYDERMIPCHSSSYRPIYHIVLEHNHRHRNAAVYANGILVESTDENTLQRVQEKGINHTK